MGEFESLGVPAHLVQDLLDLFVHFAGIVPSGGLKDKAKVVVDIAVGQQFEILENDAQLSPQVGNVLFLEQLQIEAYHLPGSLPQGQVGVEGLHKTALATASLSNDID